MAKTPKPADNAPTGRSVSLRARIKGIFNGIRIARVVLRHLSACLSELFALDSEELERGLPVAVDLAEVPNPLEEGLSDHGR